MIKKYTYPFSLILACIALAIVSSLFVRQFSDMRGSGTFHTRHSQRPLLLVQNIEGWMTFEYINRTFSIPNDYLQDTLRITSTSYPKITITKASTFSNNPSDYLDSVKAAIEKYISQGAVKK